MKKLIVLLFLAFFSLVPVLSQEDEYEQEQVETTEEHHPSNELGLFLGATSYTGTGSWTAFTLGLEYEHVFHFTPAIFLGGYAEMITGDHREYLFGAPIGLEYLGFKLFMAPSIVIEEEHTNQTPTEQKVNFPKIQAGEENLKESTTKFFMRFGTGYKFHFGNFAIIPNIAVDIISSKTYVVYGLTFGYGF